jgi:class 3 adenylate cyclase/predicted ATPase
MHCPSCGFENSEGLKFCNDCGASLRMPCAQCGFVNQPQAKFCGECGVALSPRARASTAPPLAPRPHTPLTYTPGHLAEKILTSKAALEGERKQVTVLFADLKGSMELLADRDPEEARQLLDPVLERLMDAVHRYEGTVNQVMGDGIMALFGAPVAHEDHAVRACYAALAMQESVKQYAAEVHCTKGVPVHIRVGLNSGEVVVRAIGSDLHMDYTAVGQTTHLAARMEQMAMPGSILITAEVLRLAEGYVQVKALGPAAVKGLRAPVPVYEVRGAGPARTRLQAAAGQGLTHFVGRDRELDHLYRGLEQAGRGHGQVVALVGEPGVGKSRLVEECLHTSRTQGWMVVETRAISYGQATPYLPVLDLLKAYCGIDARDDPQRMREKVAGKVLGLDEALRPILPPALALLDVPVDGADWLRLDPLQRRRRTLDALKRLLLRESQRHPLLVVFEDLHWIDTETQALLDSLVESLPAARILLLVNYRPEYQHGWRPKTYYTQLRLDPLSAASADELLQALLGDDPSLAPLKTLLVERTEGNPFFLEESVRTLAETGVLIGAPGAYCLARALPTIQVPATVQAVLGARIDRLPPEDKRLLQTAAVIGAEVPLALLQAIAELPEDSLHRGLAHLQTAEFLYEMPLFPEPEYTFKHALTHEVAYGNLLQERRRVLHTRITEAIATIYADRVADQVERLAHHALRGEMWDKALAYCWQAGQRASARSAYVEAVAHLTTGLEVLKRLPENPERSQHELDFQITLGHGLRFTKGFGAPEVEHAFARARALCQQGRDTPQHFSTLHGLLGFYSNRAKLHIARELGEQLLSLAQRLDDAVSLIGAHGACGVTDYFLGALPTARRHLEQSIALYDAQQHRTAVPSVTGALANVAEVLWLLGYQTQALCKTREALTLAQQHSSVFHVALIRSYALVPHVFRREGRIVLERAEAVLALVAEHEFAQWVAQDMIFKGWALAEQGHATEGIAQMRQGLAAWRETGAELNRPFFLALLATGYRRMGQMDQGLLLVDEALVLVEATGERWCEAELHRLKGELILSVAGDQAQQAEASFHHALTIARSQHAKSWELRAAISLSRLWQQQGMDAAAHELLAEVYGWFTEGFDSPDLQEAQGLLKEWGRRALSCEEDAAR